MFSKTEIKRYRKAFRKAFYIAKNYKYLQIRNKENKQKF